MPPPTPSRRPEPSKASDNHGASGAASKEENIYIPAFISKRPFYAGNDDQADYLDHQRSKKTRTEGIEPYALAKKSAPARTKWKKGACENCGAEGHKAVDCLQRQRKKGAKFTGQDIQADDVARESASGWDAKRDRWYNYDPREHKKTISRYEEMEELKKLALEQEKKRQEEEADEDEDGDKYAEEVDMGKHQPTSTKQLRIREDTAKYLLNLDLDSAKYDPKTRTLVDSGATADKAAELFAEEGFMRGTGDAAEFELAQKYAWEAQEKAGDSTQHLQANPTAGEFYRKKAKDDVEKQRAERERELREKYGISEDSTLPDDFKEMAVTESETFVEYDELGMVKGAPKTMAKSKYAEDLLINNHKSVWGSWWSDFKWGYACCHSFIKNSYCTGEDGIKAWDEAELQRTGVGLAREEDKEAEPELQTSHKSTAPEQDKKSVLQSKEDFPGAVTEAEMDEYRRKKVDAEDPMAKFL
ncbi:hypothetical protein MKZ38_006594 [Zalerion maritima]|uniref:Pre-mRNA-splicing factor SLU7 n=1 Tax=Zalerion maritima TaxID=339359 RepID=A0AAD5RJU0_9PEZI|nr:hypothetical protein MKZ38_006594 [Zalerion maritima]